MNELLNLPHGPRRYIIERCPYCGRRLAEWFEGDDHVTHLHGRAGITMTLHIPRSDIDDDSPYHEYPATPVEGSSICLRWLCRIRRRLDKQHP